MLTNSRATATRVSHLAAVRGVHTIASSAMAATGCTTISSNRSQNAASVGEPTDQGGKPRQHHLDNGQRDHGNTERFHASSFFNLLRRELVFYRQLRDVRDARVRVVVDVYAPGAAVAELVAGECADDALKVGRCCDLLAQGDAVDV